MDGVIKVYFDQFRQTAVGLPPELKGKVKGKLVSDQALMERWRNWRTGLRWRTTVESNKHQAEVELFGALDDCLVLTDKKSNELYIPLDYKTRGSAPISGDSEKYYQTQLDTYALLLEANGFATADFGYLIYYFPKEVQKQGKVIFNVQPVQIGVNAERAKALLEQAVEVLLGPMPKHHQGCEFCGWHSLALEFD